MGRASTTFAFALKAAAVGAIVTMVGIKIFVQPREGFFTAEEQELLDRVADLGDLEHYWERTPLGRAPAQLTRDPAREAELRTLVDNAFKGVELGDGVSLHQAEAITMEASIGDQGAARARDTAKDWHEVAASADLKGTPGRMAPTGLDNAGWRFYLPAYLTLGLNSPAEPAVHMALLDLTAFVVPGEDPRDTLTPEQRAAASLAIAYIRERGPSDCELLDSGSRRYWPCEPPLPRTRPEVSNYAQTSNFDDVTAYMQAAARACPEILLTSYGTTEEERQLPLAVIGAPAATAESVLRTGKLRIFLQANIHAGEVEGKEAMLWLLRSIAQGERKEWAEKVVLLISPIYNADGNERVHPANRGSQHGPVDGMGQRHNAKECDLNRDCTKLETAEGRAMAKLLNEYDPQVIVDMHATNGSDHGYYLTYEAPGSPLTSKGIATMLNAQLLPDVTRAVKAKHNWDLFYYGGPGDKPERAWYSDADLYKPRYHHTYWGVRNRLGILSEAYAYATFEDRIKATYRFVEEIVNWSAANADAIRKVTAAADAESIIGTQQAVRGTLEKTRDSVDIVLADTVEVPNPKVPDHPMKLRKNGSERIEKMPFYGTIKGTETSLVPAAYVIAATPENAKLIGEVRARLAAHGIRTSDSSAPLTVKGEHFKITSSKKDARPYRGGGGHALRTLEGAWEATDIAVPGGSLIIPMNQPLARLAFVLLDPRSDDGFTAWNALDGVLGAEPAPTHYPIARTMEAERLK